MRFEKFPLIHVNFRGIFAFYSSADCRLLLVLSYTEKRIFIFHKSDFYFQYRLFSLVKNKLNMFHSSPPIVLFLFGLDFRLIFQ